MGVRLFLAIVFVSMWVLPPNTGFAFEVTQAQCKNAIDCAANSVVSLLPDWSANFSRSEEPEGSGVVIGEGSLVATADHVLGPAISARVRTRDGRIIEAEIVMRDQASDVALLRIDEELPKFNLSRNVEVAQRVCAVGNSFGLDISLSCGVVSAKQMSGVGFNPIEDFIQTDAAVNPGMSGGALVDEEGQLVGMLSAIFTKTSDANIGVNFAVSAELLAKVLADFKKQGRVHHHKIGIILKPNNPKNSEGYVGAQVMRVSEGSNEALAGIKLGDIILAANNRRIKKAGGYKAALFLSNEETGLKLLVLRDKELIELVLKTN